MEKITANKETAIKNFDGTAVLALEEQPVTSILSIRGLDCADCAAKLEKKLAQLKGVTSAKVNFPAAKVKVEHTAPVQNIINAVKDSGYGVDVDTPKEESLLRVYGLDCADCAAKLESKVAALPGVENVRLVFATGQMKVTHSEPVDGILRAVSGMGYRTELENNVRSGKIKEDRLEKIKIYNTIAAGVFLAAGFVLQLTGFSRTAVNVLYLLSILSGGFFVAKSGLYSLRTFSLDMNFLITAAVAGAVAIGEFSEAATVVFLFSLGNLLQNYTLEKTRRSISSLMDLSPREALVRRDGREFKVPVEEVGVGETVIVKPGENITVDGRVLTGRSAVNESPITGESMPAAKKVGDSVYAGTINGEGSLEIETTKKVEDSTISRIIHLVEEAQAQKAPSQQTVDVFAKYYTPAVLAGALAVAVLPTLLFGQEFRVWFNKALILLVISCPCALVISTPVSIISAIGSAARKGVLIKGGAFLEQAGRIGIMAFDKTGTITRGRPEVMDVIAFDGFSKNDVLSIAGAVEKRSEHPLAGAVMHRLKTEEMQVKEGKNFESFAGKGAGAEIEGNVYYVGNEYLFAGLGTDLGKLEKEIKKHKESNRTVLLVGTDKVIMGIITVADSIREGTARVIERLYRAGIKRIVMLTGDNEGTAREVAASAGIKDYRANLLPGDKLAAIKELKGSGKVAMVGDGINDAPALAAADLGIAMGGAGTDTAIETSDIALMSDDLSKLPYTIKLSRQAVRIIKQNITFSLIVKAVFIIATLAGHATLWMAVFADTGTSLLVTLNGMRLMRLKE